HCEWQRPSWTQARSGMCSSRNAASASTRVSAPMYLQSSSPNDVTPTTWLMPLIDANDGPPLSPLHLPLASFCEKQRTLASSRWVLPMGSVEHLDEVRSLMTNSVPL